jgi:hypothetical protein
VIVGDDSVDDRAATHGGKTCPVIKESAVDRDLDETLGYLLRGSGPLTYVTTAR